MKKCVCVCVCVCVCLHISTWNILCPVVGFIGARVRGFCKAAVGVRAPSIGS